MALVGSARLLSGWVALSALTLNQRVHSSSLCAPTIAIKDLTKKWRLEKSGGVATGMQ
jgi:hypothetical protein